ncbi:MAG: sporulation protein YqfD [Clostridium sp.]|uniref:sporulation protein YqfD n=1 Tax=Clostridium sp. TaxID=1506 RepID=UPI00303C44BD
MMKINNFNKSFLRVEIEATQCEKILNYLWNNKVDIRRVKRNNRFSMTLDINMSDYHYLVDGVNELSGRLRIVESKGINFLSLKLKGRKALVVGVGLFFFMLYYLGTFVWEIDITTDKYLAPLEVRNILKEYGIMIGSTKESIDVLKVEENLVTAIDEIMWVKVRLEGSKLKVEIIERQEPPTIKEKEYTGNLVARKSGVINRVYTSAGTVVKVPGQVVNEGEIIVKGQEGKEGRVFTVKAEGRIYATTFYEDTKEVENNTIETKRTGNESVGYFVNINNKKIYLKKSLNNYINYDKIETSWGVFVKETCYETEEVLVETNVDSVIKELENKIRLNLDRGVKILDVKSEVEKQEEKYKVRVLVTVEEDIASSEAVVSEDISEGVTPST